MIYHNPELGKIGLRYDLQEMARAGFLCGSLIVSKGRLAFVEAVLETDIACRDDPSVSSTVVPPVRKNATTWISAEHAGVLADALRAFCLTDLDPNYLHTEPALDATLLEYQTARLAEQMALRAAQELDLIAAGQVAQSV